MTFEEPSLRRIPDAYSRNRNALVNGWLVARRELRERVRYLALHKTPERVMFGLLQLAELLGQPVEDGCTRIPGLTHETIAEYVCTSREIVTDELNRLRREGLLRYSRKHMDVDTSAMRERLGSACNDGRDAGAGK